MLKRVADSINICSYVGFMINNQGVAFFPKHLLGDKKHFK